MNELQREAIARIKFLAADKRKRVLLTDHAEWLETKLAEIARLAETFPVEAWQPTSRPNEQGTR